MLNEILAVMAYYLFLVSSLVRTHCLLCDAFYTLNSVECASYSIDVGLHAVRCIMHSLRGLCMYVYHIRCTG